MGQACGAVMAVYGARALREAKNKHHKHGNLQKPSGQHGCRSAEALVASSRRLGVHQRLRGQTLQETRRFQEGVEAELGNVIVSAVTSYWPTSGKSLADGKCKRASRRAMRSKHRSDCYQYLVLCTSVLYMPSSDPDVISTAGFTIYVQLRLCPCLVG